MVKPPKGNLKWATHVLRAKAGFNSKLAVPKKIAQKARAKLKRTHGSEGKSFRPDASSLKERLEVLGQKKAARQQHHMVKQLMQSAKKARLFLVRRLLRKLAKEGEASSDAEKLNVLRSLSIAAAVRRAVRPLGIADVDVLDEAQRNSAAAAGATDAAIRPVLLDDMERRLLGTPAVQQQLDKLRAHLEKPAMQVLALKRPARPDETGGGAAAGTEEAAERGLSRPAGPRKRARPQDLASTSRRPAAMDSEGRFLNSLMDDGGGVDLDPGEGDAESEQRGDALVLGSAASRDAPLKVKKVKNVISRSGNRMGQRQRKALLEQAQANSSGGAALGGERFNSRKLGVQQRRHVGSKSGDRPSPPHSWRGAQRAAAPQPLPASAEKRHPSWEAKKVGQGAIRAFEGKKVVFG